MDSSSKVFGIFLVVIIGIMISVAYNNFANKKAQEEKIKQQKGVEISKETFKVIKEDILGQVKVLNTQRPVEKIDWKGNEGKREEEKIFDSVIKIICDQND